MRTIITIAVLFLYSIYVQAQTAEDGQAQSITSATNLPRPGDILEKLEIRPIPVRQCGDSILWDLSEYKTGKKHLIRYRQAQNGQIIELENNATKYYANQGDTLRLTRHGQPGMSVCYQVPEPVIKYPMGYGSIMEGYFYGEGSLGNVKYLRNAGYTTHCIDSRGTFVTPDGDTIKNVLRSHYSRIGTTHIDVDFSHSFSATRDSSMFSSDSIRHWLATDSVIHHIDRWQWYAQGYRYPVAQAETYKIYYYGTPVDSVKRYYYYRAVDQQYDLEDDFANEQIRYNDSSRKWYTDNSYTNQGNRYPGGNSIKNNCGPNSPPKSHNSAQDNAGNNISGNDMQFANYPYSTAYPTIVTNSTTVDYGTATEVEVNILLHNTAGAVMWQHSETCSPGEYSVTCPMESVPAGDYLVVTHIGNESFSTKLIKR